MFVSLDASVEDLVQNCREKGVNYLIITEDKINGVRGCYGYDTDSKLQKMLDHAADIGETMLHRH